VPIGPLAGLEARLVAAPLLDRPVFVQVSPQPVLLSRYELALVLFVSVLVPAYASAVLDSVLVHALALQLAGGVPPVDPLSVVLAVLVLDLMDPPALAVPLLAYTMVLAVLVGALAKNLPALEVHHPLPMHFPVGILTPPGGLYFGEFRSGWALPLLRTRGRAERQGEQNQ
jgi:hypothetical protein